MEGLFRRIQRGHIEQIPPRYSQDLQDFITMCLQQNPSLRPTADQLLRIPSLQKHLQQELVAN
jgi:serine/threonine protein kinase